VKIAAVAFPKGAFSKVEDVLDRPVISKHFAGEPLWMSLGDQRQRSGSGPDHSGGHARVTVRVNDVGAWLASCCRALRVDVLVTGHPPSAEGDMTATALQNMLVLSFGNRHSAGRPRAGDAGSTITLLATPAQAETLTLAGNEGRCNCAAQFERSNIEKTNGRYINELFGVLRHPSAPVTPRRFPSPNRCDCGRAGAAPAAPAAAGPNRDDPRKPAERGNAPRTTN